MTGSMPPAATSSHALEARLNEVNRLIYQNQPAQAMALAQDLFSVPSAKTAAQSLIALAAAMANDREKALEALAQLPDPDALKKADVLVAVGSAWFKLNEPGEAIRFLAAATKASPEHPLGNARLGACLLGVGNVKEALPFLEKAVSLLPQSGGAALNLARAYLTQGKVDRAMAELDRTADAKDRDEDIYRMTRADILTALGRAAEAEDLLRQAASGGNLPAIRSFIQLLAADGRHDEAWHQLREALEGAPDNVSLLEMGAELAQVRGRFGEAARFLRRALEQEGENPALWARLAMLSGRRLGEKEAREAADKALALTEGQSGPPRALSLAAHAQVLDEENRPAEAETAYRDALKAFPGSVPALSGLGHLLMQRGRVEEATTLFEELKKRAPLQGWSQLIHAREVPDDPVVLEQMEKAARRPSLEGPVQSHLLFTLASAWERKKDYEKAWALATEANAAAKAHLSYRPEGHRGRVEREIARFSREFIDSRRALGLGVDSDLPVFVLGMPRSGTTLVEQILGSHSQVFGAGELSQIPEFTQKLNAWEARLGTRRQYPECADDLAEEDTRRFAEKMLEELQAFAPHVRRIVDKLPHNFEHVGLIKLLFPRARILHMKREPRDVAISNYFVDYAAKFGGMGFAYDLGWIGEQLVDHQRLMDHWHRVFPGEILEVDYDALVEDVEGWARRIIDFLGLDWEPGVLRFQELDRSVKTASVWQVRQPVYTTSKAKWKRYEQYLAPLEATLAERPSAPEPLPLPDLPPGLFLSAMNQLESGSPAEAETAFRRLLEAHPTHAAAHHFLGAALYRQGRLDEARKAMRHSVGLHRGHVQWLENLAICEEALGNKEVAGQLREMASKRKSGRLESAEEIPGVPVAPAHVTELADTP